MHKQTASYLYLQDKSFIKKKFLSIYEYWRLDAILAYFYYSIFSRIQFCFVNSDNVAIIVHPRSELPRLWHWQRQLFHRQGYLCAAYLF